MLTVPCDMDPGPCVAMPEPIQQYELLTATSRRALWLHGSTSSGGGKVNDHNYLDSPRRSPGSPDGTKGWIKETFSTRKPWIFCQILWENPDFFPKTTSIISRKGDDL